MLRAALLRFSDALVAVSWNGVEASATKCRYLLSDSVGESLPETQAWLEVWSYWRWWSPTAAAGATPAMPATTSVPRAIRRVRVFRILPTILGSRGIGVPSRLAPVLAAARGGAEYRG